MGTANLGGDKRDVLQERKALVVSWVACRLAEAGTAILGGA